MGGSGVVGSYHRLGFFCEFFQFGLQDWEDVRLVRLLDIELLHNRFSLLDLSNAGFDVSFLRNLLHDTCFVWVVNAIMSHVRGSPDLILNTKEFFFFPGSSSFVPEITAISSSRISLPLTFPCMNGVGAGDVYIVKRLSEIIH